MITKYNIYESILLEKEKKKLVFYKRIGEKKK